MSRAKRREFSKPVRVEIMNRAKRPTGFECEECGTVVASGQIDHTIAEGLVVDKTKKLTAKDGKFMCWPCHQGPEGKTPKDKATIAKAKRNEAKDLGIKNEPTIESAGFAKKPARESKPPVFDGPRRPMFRNMTPAELAQERAKP